MVCVGMCRYTILWTKDTLFIFVHMRASHKSILWIGKMWYSDYRRYNMGKCIFPPLFPRQVRFCLGSKAALCPLWCCDGWPRTGQCIGHSSNFWGPWSWRTLTCNLAPQAYRSQPLRKKTGLLLSVSKREGKLIGMHTAIKVDEQFVTRHWLRPTFRIVHVVQFLGKTNIGMVSDIFSGVPKCIKPVFI